MLVLAEDGGVDGQDGEEVIGRGIGLDRHDCGVDGRGLRHDSNVVSPLGMKFVSILFSLT